MAGNAGTREVETFGAPMLDADANRELCEEHVKFAAPLDMLRYKEPLAVGGAETVPDSPTCARFQ
jgi:hypothetical protein